MADSYQVAIVARELYRATLIGNAPPAIEKLRNRMRSPQPGDLVLEVSRFGGMLPDRFDPDCIGRLLRIEGERFVVEPLDRPGEEQGWLNAEFVAFPDRHNWLGDA